MSATTRATDTAGTGGSKGATATVRAVVGVALVAVAAVLPFLENRALPYVFERELGSPGVLNLLATMLVIGALAMTYDLMFGYTGLLSFGHALYFALGVYGVVVAMDTFALDLASASLVVAAAAVVVPLVLGAICLRVKGIAFAMVTLAFAQAAAIFVARDPLEVTGGDLGRSLPFEQVPEALVGVANTRHVYWVALGLVVVVYLVGRMVVASPAGRVWQAIRENEQRVEVLGLNPTTYKLGVFVLASFLAAACGVVYVLVVGGAQIQITAATFTLTLLVMVVLGGAGRLWGALLGGMLYTYLETRLGQLASSPEVQELPGVVRVPLSEPLFVLGTLFVVVVLVLPGGIAGAFSRGGATRRRPPAADDRGAERSADQDDRGALTPAGGGTS